MHMHRQKADEAVRITFGTFFRVCSERYLPEKQIDKVPLAIRLEPKVTKLSMNFRNQLECCPWQAFTA